ncbi:hypothetical protein DCO57_11820 [Labrenzia sp. 011]|nr:hypothetical protein DCO57_11820 [Labrenzia sp. 011]
MSVESSRILLVTRIFGFVFVFVLVSVVVLATLPNRMFLVSENALINAPVQTISSKINGQVVDLSVQIGQEVAPFAKVAEIENFERDNAIAMSMRMELLQLTDRQKALHSTIDRTSLQLGLIREQANATKQGLIEDLKVLARKAENQLLAEESRVEEQESIFLQKKSLVDIGQLSETVLTQYRQKLDAASHRMETARDDLTRQTNMVDSIARGVYSGGLATNLMSLEFQEKSLDMEHRKALSELEIVRSRVGEIERMVAVEGLSNSAISSDNVLARQPGRIVSVEVAPGETVAKGAVIARTMNCEESFVVAVFPGREVEDVLVGTPALVNVRSLGAKYNGRVERVVRYYNTGAETRYFKKFPDAEGHEVYVFIRVNDTAQETEATPVSDKKFFGCNVGEEVIVALGEPLLQRAANLFRSSKPLMVAEAAAASGQPEVPQGVDPLALENDRIAALSGDIRDLVKKNRGEKPSVGK